MLLRGYLLLITRWTARIVGLLIVGLVLLFAVGEGFNPRKLTGVELAMSAAFVVALGGMVALWKWEGIGGFLVILGIGVFYSINLVESGRFPGGWVFPLCFLPGVLALVCWVSRRCAAPRQDIIDDSTGRQN